MFGFFDKSDKQIQIDVVNELRWDPSVSSSDIDVVAKDGVVTLNGNVPHFYERTRAETAARRVSGVRAVADELQVQVAVEGPEQRSDAEIARSALNSLEWNYSVPKNIQVTVDKGWLTLSGETEWDYQRNAAKNSVSQLLGVVGISNLITIKSKIQPIDIKQRIEDALRRGAENDASKIKIEVEGDAVTLTGEIQSFAEIEEARLAAWNAPGVMTVKNELKLPSQH